MWSNPRFVSRILRYRGLVALAAFVVFFLNPQIPTYAQGASGNPAAQLVVLESDASHVVLELSVSGYESRVMQANGKDYTVLSVPTLGHTGEAGKPQLPIRTAPVGIPAGAQVSLRILDDQSQRQVLRDPILPVPTEQIQFDPRETLPRFAGNLLAPDAKAYASDQLYPAESVRLGSTGTLRSQHYAAVEFHPLQYNPVTRDLVFHRILRVELLFTFPRGISPQEIGTTQDEGPFEPVLQSAILNYATAKNWRSPVELPEMAAPALSISDAATGLWYRIGVNQDGIYRVTCTDLMNAGVALSTLQPTTLRLYKQGQEMAIRVRGASWSACNPAKHYFEFFGQAPTSKYSSTNIYWLTFGGVTAGKRMAVRSGSGTGTSPSSFDDTLHFEKNFVYLSMSPRAEEVDHWVWEYLYPAAGVNSRSYTFQLPTLYQGGSSAALTLNLAAYTLFGHHTQVKLNSYVILDRTWSGQTSLTETIPFSATLLIPGSNTIEIVEPNDLDAYDIVYTDSFDLTYPSTFVTSDDEKRFGQTASGTWKYQVSGFTSPSIDAFDITDPYNVAWFSGTTISPPSPNYTLQFTDAIASPHTYLTVGASRLTPTGIARATPANLKRATNAADYIVISYGSFIPNVKPLTDYRKSQGLRVKVVDVQNVYDEFSDGVMDPQAIHDFLAYAYTHWQKPAPSFVLLVGDGTYDPKGYCATPSDCGFTDQENLTFIPPYLRMVDPWLGETASDNDLVAFNTGNNLPSMAIGRLPANSTAEVDAMVSKILNYEQNPPAGSWRNQLTFVAGNAYLEDGSLDGAGNFWSMSDRVASNSLYVPAPLTVNRIYYNPCNPNVYPNCALPYPPYTTPGAVQNAIDAAIDNGSLIVNYTGHGSIQEWGANSSITGGYQLFSTNDVDGLTNGGKTPLMIEMTCYTGYFQYPDPSISVLAERNVRRSGGGAVASWAGTGLGVGYGHDLLDQGFFGAVMQEGVTQIGLAANAGKVNLWFNGGGGNRDLIDTFVLLGDPATRLLVSPAITVDEGDPRVQYNSWSGVSDVNASGGSYRSSRVANAAAKFTFSGTGVTWTTLTGPDQGKAQVLVDGLSRGTVDLYSPNVQYNVPKPYAGLSNKTHTLTVLVLGTSNVKSTGSYVAIDNFVVSGTTTEESSSAVRYNSWAGALQAGAYGGAYRSSATAGAAVTFTFYGTEVDWITAKGPAFGKASVTIDGIGKGTFDLYGSNTQWQQVTIPFPNLTAKMHTLTIKVLGTRNALSKGYAVVVDAFQYH